MRNILSTIFATLFTFFLFSGAAMAQGKVMKDSEGNFFIQKQVIPPADTGVVLEEGINLDPTQLKEVMRGGKVITNFTISEVWGRYYLYRVQTTHTTEVVQREGNIVRRVQMDKEEVVEKFNIFLLSAGGYIILMLVSNILIRRGSDTTAAFAAFAAFAAVAAAAAFAAFLATTFATFVAFLAAPPRNLTDIKISTWATVVGAVSMVLAVGIALAN